MTSPALPPAPPWLRFQAYVIGLPKTGSTSLAAIFRDYRTGHEHQMLQLMSLGVARDAGRISSTEFWSEAGTRLTKPTLELDAATCHHMYADLLAERFPSCQFIHPIRDVRSWINSMLDMALRLRRVRRVLGITTQDWNDGSDFYTGGVATLDPDDDGLDLDAVRPLMATWSTHMDAMARALPDGRTLRIRTADISQRISDLADFVGVPQETLRADSSHANRSPATFVRFSLPECSPLLADYASLCGDRMAADFPEEHEAITRHTSATGTIGDWAAHVRGVDEWAREAIAAHGVRAAF